MASESNDVLTTLESTQSFNPDQKALGLAYCEKPPSEILPLMDMVEDELITKLRPTVLMGMMTLHHRAEREGTEARNDDVGYFEINVANKPGRSHRLIYLPGACAYKLCAGCNYCGIGRPATEEDVDKAINLAKEDHENYLNPKADADQKYLKYHRDHPDDKFVIMDIISGGSLFSPREVPDEVRKYLWQKISDYGKEQKALGRYVAFVTEARVDDLTPELITEMTQALKGTVDEIEIGFGVERVDQLGQQILWNKMMPDDWKSRIQMLKDPKINNGVEIVKAAHIMLAVPGETEAEGIQYASSSIKQLIDEGLADRVVLMATNRKKATVPGVIQSDIPSIFTLAETLKKLKEFGIEAEDPDKYLKSVMIRGFASGSESAEYMYAGCPECQPIENMLKDWHSQDYPRLVEMMEHVNCSCKKDWEREITTKPKYTRAQRGALIWNYLAQNFWGKSLFEAIEAFEKIKL